MLRVILRRPYVFIDGIILAWDMRTDSMRVPRPLNMNLDFASASIYKINTKVEDVREPTREWRERQAMKERTYKRCFSGRAFIVASSHFARSTLRSMICSSGSEPSLSSR